MKPNHAVRAVGALFLTSTLVGLAGCTSPQASDGPAAAPEKKADKGKAPAAEHPPDDKGGAAGAAAGGGGVLEELAKDLTLRQQEQKALAEHYKKTGRKYHEAFDYKEAARNFEKAVQSDPNDKEAQRLLGLANLLAGDRVEQFKSLAELLGDTRSASVQQEKFELARLHKEGQDLLTKGEYDKAIQRFEMVLEKVRWFPYPIDNGDLEKSSRAFVLQAKRQKRDFELSERAERERRALDAAVREEQAQRAASRARINDLLNHVHEDLYRDRYEKALATIDEVLQKEPDNEQALKLKEVAEQGQHLRQEDDLFHLNQTESKQDSINNEVIAVPTLSRTGITFPDRDYWREKVQKRPYTIARSQTEEAAWIQEYRKILRSRKVRLNFPQTPFAEAINFLQDLTGLNFTISKAIDTEQIKVNVRLNDVTVESALQTILELCNPPLALSFKNETIMITPKEEAKGEYYLDIYDVQDILAQLPDFPGPRMRVSAGRGGGGGRRGGGSGNLSFDDDEQEEAGAVIEPDKLEAIVKNSTGGDEAWGDPASYELHRGQVIVNQTRRVHENIRRVLANLRKNTGLFVQIETRFILIHNDFLQDIGIDYRGLGRSPNPIFGTPMDMDGGIATQGNRGGTNQGQANDIGFGRKVFHGGRASQRRLGPQSQPVSPGLPAIPFFGSSYLGGRVQNVLEAGDDYFLGTRLNNASIRSALAPKGLAFQSTWLDPFQINAILRAEEERFREKIVTAPVVVAANRQRVHISVITQRAYISDYELSSGGTGLTVAEVADPIIQTFQEGVVLDVRPTISADRKYITLDVRPTLATLVGGQFKQIPVNLGTISRAAINVNIEVPEITLQEAYTSVTLPDGGTALVGGFRQFVERQQRSGLPFVDNVPFLNVFFKREAELRETESLVILIKAQIIAVREEEAKRFGTGPK